MTFRVEEKKLLNSKFKKNEIADMIMKNRVIMKFFWGANTGIVMF